MPVNSVGPVGSNINPNINLNLGSNVGQNVGPSSLLTSYLANQNNQNTAPVMQSAPSAQNASLQTFQTQTQAQKPVQSVPVQVPPVQTPVVQAPMMQPQAPAAPVIQPQNNVLETGEPVENKAKEPENKGKEPNFFKKTMDKAKEFFKNPKAKKVALGIGAAIVVAGIIIFALCSRKKPDVSPELENTLQDLVDTISDFFSPGT